MNNLLKSLPGSCIFPVFFFIAISCGTDQGTTVTTTNVSGITQTTAQSGGKLAAGKRTSIVSRGICWGTSVDPAISGNKTVDGNGEGSFISNMTGLLPGTEYYVRAYAISTSDTIFGNNVIFVTEGYGTVSDIDGNTYNNVRIGNQTWMAENLKTKKYNDGREIPQISDESKWSGWTSPGMCWYRNEEEAFNPTYGALYNWYAINTGKLCPSGWHVPSDEEWTELSTFLGGEEIAGGKLKEAGITYWVEPNTGATNEDGFTAFPGGFRYYDGKFFDFGFSCYFWTSTEYTASRAYFRFLYYNEILLYRFNNNKKNGFSVRCIKN